MTNEIPQCIHIPDGSVVVSGELFDMACAAIAERDKLLAEIERVRTLCEVAYGIWSRNRGPVSEAADRMADILNEILQGLAHTHEPLEQRPADGTRDGDGVWQGGFWHPDTPDPLDEWRLMEFAPKDGTRILALVTEVQFYRDTETPNELIPVVVKWTGEYSGWSMPGHGGLQPTLWLPIKLTNDPQGASEQPVATPGALPTGEDSVRQTAESSRPRELLASEAASFDKTLARSPRIISQGASRDASPPYHVDATGMTREPPHCPTCDCGTPADLVGALQDVVHTDPGPVRAGRSVRQGEPGASIAGFPVVVDPTMPPDQIELRNDGNCPTGDWPHNFATETTERMTKGRCIYCGTPAQRTSE